MTKRVNVGLVIGGCRRETIAAAGPDDRVSLFVLGGVQVLSKMNRILGNPVRVVSVTPSHVGKGGSDVARGMACVVDCNTAPNPDCK